MMCEIEKRNLSLRTGYRFLFKCGRAPQSLILGSKRASPSGKSFPKGGALRTPPFGTDFPDGEARLEKSRAGP